MQMNTNEVENKLLELSNDINEEMKKLGQLKADLIDLKNSEDNRRAVYYKEATDAVDSEGKPTYKSEAAKDKYVHTMMLNDGVTVKKKDAERQIAEKEAIVNGLKYKFRATEQIAQMVNAQMGLANNVGNN